MDGWVERCKSGRLERLEDLCWWTDVEGRLEKGG